jgi:hypothetical protein
MVQAITTIRVGDGEIKLHRPASYSAILDVIGVLGRNLPRGYGAAVGACWPAAAPWPGEKQPSARLLAADGLDYGGRVIDDLRAAGMPWPTIADAGRALADALVEFQVSEQEVASAAGFSAEPVEGRIE